MRVGFVTQLLFDRYGAFWRALLEDAGGEPVVAEAEAVRAALGDPRVATIPGWSFRLAAAQALALAAEGVDLLVVPDLNAGAAEGAARGGAQDPWIAAFPAALRATVAGLPPVVGVPVDVAPDVEGQAVTLLHSLLHDATRVERVWARHRAAARPPRRPHPRWTRLPSERRTVGLVAQPWLSTAPLVERATREGEHVVAQHQLDPQALRAEAARVDPRLVPTDAETFGAARLFARRGSVAGVRLVVDRTSASDGWLERRLTDVLRDRVEVVALADLLADADPVDSLLIASVH